MSSPLLERYRIKAIEADIVGWTKSAEREIISSYGSPIQVIRMGRVAIKSEILYEDEFRNQQQAFQVLCADIFQVPEVNHFFEAGY